jgi:hypothetical protein
MYDEKTQGILGINFMHSNNSYLTNYGQNIHLWTFKKSNNSGCWLSVSAANRYPG